MKSLIFIFTIFFIQLGHSQDDVNEKLTDSITIDSLFIKQLDSSAIKKVKFNIDSQKIALEGREYYQIYINVLFHNKTKSLIVIDNIRGGSNYVVISGDSVPLVLLPNKQKSIKMCLALSRNNTKGKSRVLSFSICGVEVNSRKVYRQQIFEIQ